MTSVRASVVIPAFNSAATITKTIDSAMALDWPGGVEVVVVDNGSSDATVQLASSRPVRVVHESRRGRSAARNRGAKEAAGTLLAFADADCELPANWLSESATLLLGRRWVGAVQASIRKRDRAAPERNFVHARWYRPFLDTCALVTTTTAFHSARGFDEELQRNVDMDFSFRLLACGYALAVLPDVVAIKHHDLDSRQVLRRGWQGGKSVALVDKKWGAVMPPASVRALDMTKTWLRLLLRSPSEPTPFLEALEQTSKLAGYAAALPRRARSRTYGPCTALGALLGPRRALVLTPEQAYLYDSSRRTRLELGMAEVDALSTLLADDPPPSSNAELVRVRLGLAR